jgi:hypothetical protein
MQKQQESSTIFFNIYNNGCSVEVQFDKRLSIENGEENVDIDSEIWWMRKPGPDKKFSQLMQKIGRVEGILKIGLKPPYTVFFCIGEAFKGRLADIISEIIEIAKEEVEGLADIINISYTGLDCSKQEVEYNKQNLDTAVKGLCEKAEKSMLFAVSAHSGARFASSMPDNPEDPVAQDVVKSLEAMKVPNEGAEQVVN